MDDRSGVQDAWIARGRPPQPSGRSSPPAGATPRRPRTARPPSARDSRWCRRGGRRPGRPAPRGRPRTPAAGRARRDWRRGGRRRGCRSMRMRTGGTCVQAPWERSRSRSRSAWRRASAAGILRKSHDEMRSGSMRRKNRLRHDAKCGWLPPKYLSPNAAVIVAVVVVRLGHAAAEHDAAQLVVQLAVVDRDRRAGVGLEVAHRAVPAGGVDDERSPQPDEPQRDHVRPAVRAERRDARRPGARQEARELRVVDRDVKRGHVAPG